MGMYKYLRRTWQEMPHELRSERLISWRAEPVIIKIDGPTRLDRAHALGYKAKQGFIMVRTRIGKGTRKREVPSGGRKPGNAGLTGISPKQNLQHIAEMRAARKFPNLEVLNSYYVAEDGMDLWFEVIMVDPNHSCIKNDPDYNWICEHRGRVFMGLTSAGKSSRMMRGKGTGFERKNSPGRF